MPIQLPTFRELKTEDVAPISTGYQQGIQNYINSVKAAYLPMQSQADILSKSAYAAYSPYGYLQKALDNPLFFGSLNDEQRKMIMDKVSNIPTNPLQSVSNSFGGGDQSPGLLKTLWNNVTGNGSNNQAAPSQAQVQPQPEATSGGTPMTSTEAVNYVNSRPDNQGSPISTNAPVAPVPTGAPAQSGDTGVDLSDPSMNAYNKDFGSPMANTAAAIKFPSPAQKIAIKAASKRKETESRIEPEAERKMWTEKLTDSQKVSEGSQDVLYALDSFHSFYKKLGENEKGFLGGRVLATSSNAQNADQFAKMMATANLKALVGGRITNNEFQIGDSLKPSRYMNPVAEENAYNYYKGRALRDKVIQPFYSQAKKMGLTVPEADSIWNQFIQERPFYDPQTGKALESNVKNWKTYLENANNGISNVIPEISTDQTIGGKLLSSNFELPKFNSATEFRDWYNKQPRMIQDAVNAKLGGK